MDGGFHLHDSWTSHFISPLQNPSLLLLMSPSPEHKKQFLLQELLSYSFSPLALEYKGGRSAKGQTSSKFQNRAGKKKMILQKMHVAVLELEQAGQVLHFLLRASVAALGQGPANYQLVGVLESEQIALDTGGCW